MSSLLCFRHDGYGQQYPGMPYGMHPSGMYPQQQVRESALVCSRYFWVEGQISKEHGVRLPTKHHKITFQPTYSVLHYIHFSYLPFYYDGTNVLIIYTKTFFFFFNLSRTMFINRSNSGLSAVCDGYYGNARISAYMKIDSVIRLNQYL